MAETFGEWERESAARLIELALAEDLGAAGDLTSQALIEPGRRAEILVVARARGVLSGGPVAELVFERLDPHVEWRPKLPDGSTLKPGDVVASVAGPLRSLLAGERTALNFLTHLSGIATLTRAFVDAVDGTSATILDTRKTLPGGRALAKYAVRCGGGCNHRLGLFDGCLIKDNHLSAWAEGDAQRSIAAAVRRARDALAKGSDPFAEERLSQGLRRTPAKGSDPVGMTVEVEVDSLAQLRDALEGEPDIVLLDNMPPDMLREAARLRDAQAPHVLLEASGGVTLETVRDIAECGVERISVGALTHSAPALDLAFDWRGESASEDGG
ncbi:MAG: nicotinate-nucleotide diphosphorylase [Planctomycetes bacterium]|nr:nicotinate-nucleotide diphosphorylase [Planctomycetota bacterium]